MIRAADECPYRVEGKLPTEYTACCVLLEKISGVESPNLSVVERDACDACCEYEIPSPNSLNPVFASLLGVLGAEVIRLGGVAGCDVGKAMGIRKWAHQNLAAASSDDPSSYIRRRLHEPCFYLGKPIDEQTPRAIPDHRNSVVFHCEHPRHDQTSPLECQSCCDWADRPRAEPTPVEQLVPPSQQQVGPSIQRWAVGVTTAPRQQPTLELCLDSLIRAGWKKPRLFVDAASVIPERFADFPQTIHDSRIGAWPNFYLALTELLMRHPDADAFFLVQDDTVFYDRVNLRAHLERYFWPGPSSGIVSLYCSQKYHKPVNGWHQCSDRWVWGALAMIFPTQLAKQFITDSQVLEHRWSSARAGIANIDTVIGQWAERASVPIYFPVPSLAQHIGLVSTIWPDAKCLSSRRASHFAGNTP